jgi:putative toxin-antitoxin system antitoxin component (TIGR02293 family)
MKTLATSKAAFRVAKKAEDSITVMVTPKSAKRTLKQGEKSRFTLYPRMSHWLGEHVASESDVYKVVSDGLPYSAANRFFNDAACSYSLLGPETTVRRRILEKQTFTVDESERLVRLARVTALAESLFGTEHDAQQWLSTAANYIEGAAPISPFELAVTDTGARIVESLILQTAHGVF